MAYPYDESQVLAFCADAEAAFTASAQPWNAAAGIWPARMQFDAVSMGYPAARRKHLAELKRTLPPPVNPIPGPEPPEPPIIVPIERAPLPPFDPHSKDPDTGAYTPVYTTLREEPPPADDVSWWRGDAWGLTVPGLPPVPGGADGPAQDRVLTYFLDRYGTTWEAEILARYVGYGYRNISLSPQDSFAFGTSEDDYVRMAVRCRAAGLNVHHLMRSKYYTAAKGEPPLPLDPTKNRLRERDRHAPDPSGPFAGGPDLTVPDALTERLLAEGVMQAQTPAWEMNYWSPATVREMIDHDAALIGTRCRIMLHFFPHYISWQPNEETPTDFWRKNHGSVDGVLYQCNPTWTAGMAAARAQDCLDRLAPGGLWRLSDSGRGHPIWFVMWETIATQQFNNLHDGDGRLADEDQANLKGFENTCSPGLMTVQGFGNGARRPDGTPL